MNSAYPLGDKFLTLSLHTQLIERVIHFHILPFTFPFHSQTHCSLASVWNQLGYSSCQDHQQQQGGDVSVLTWLTISRAPSSIHDSLPFFWRFFSSLPSRTPLLLLHLTFTLYPTHCSSSSILPFNGGEPQISITRPFLFTSTASLLRL